MHGKPLYFASASLFFQIPTHPRHHRAEHSRTLPYVSKSARFERIVAQHLEVPPVKSGTQNCHFLVVLRRLNDSSANIFETNGTTVRLSHLNKDYLLTYLLTYYWQKVLAKLYELWPTNGWDFRVHFGPPSKSLHIVFIHQTEFKKISQLFGSEPCLKMDVKNWAVFSQTWDPKLPISGHSTTT